jgi:hypothetical protein
MSSTVCNRSKSLLAIYVLLTETDKVGIHQLRLSILPADAAFLHLSFRDAVLQLFRISEGKVLLVAVVGKDGVNVVQVNIK